MPIQLRGRQPQDQKGFLEVQPVNLQKPTSPRCNRSSGNIGLCQGRLTASSLDIKDANFEHASYIDPSSNLLRGGSSDIEMPLLVRQTNHSGLCRGR